MYIVEVMPHMYFHYFLKGSMILGSKKHAKVLSEQDILALKLNQYKVEVIQC